jgi:nucleotide-binding universal stress UspA family protein
MPHAAASTTVVGVDGSDSSLEALGWAIREAGLTGATLNVVTAWSFPEHPTPFGIVPELPLAEDPLAETRKRLDQVVEAARGGIERLDVRTRVVHGAAATVLLESARDADLLVVGSRGLGTIAGLLLGSVSEHCVRHASCPVVVVRWARQGVST